MSGDRNEYPYICVIANRIVNDAEEWVNARHASSEDIPEAPEMRPYDQDQDWAAFDIRDLLEYIAGLESPEDGEL